MPEPIVTERIVIDGRDCRALITASHLRADGTITLVPAETWEDRESSAVAAVER